MNEDEKILVEFILSLEALIKTYRELEHRELELYDEWRTTNDRS